MTQKQPWLNPLLWVVALILINVLWANVAQQEAPNEIISVFMIDEMKCWIRFARLT